MVNFLQESRSICAPQCDWFNYIRDYLIETFAAIQITEIRVPNQVLTSTAVIQSQSPVERSQIIIASH